MLQDQAVRDRLLGPGPFPLVVEDLELGSQRPAPVLDQRPQFLLGELAAHRDGQVHRVRAQAGLAEGLGAQHQQLAAPLAGDRVDGAGGQVPHLLGAHGLDESLGRHPVQGPVQRARAYLGPQLGPVGPRAAPDLVPVHRPVPGQCVEHE